MGQETAVVATRKETAAYVTRGSLLGLEKTACGVVLLVPVAPKISIRPDHRASSLTCPHNAAWEETTSAFMYSRQEVSTQV